MPHRVGQPLAAIAASRYALGANGVGAVRPGACGSLIAASRYALGTKGVGATRPSAHMCTPGCARCLLGMVGMSKTSCAARCLTCSVQGLLRAPAEGEGGVARREDLTATAAATLERSAGTVAHGTRAARERLGRRAKVSHGRRAGRARRARCGGRVRVPRAFKRLGYLGSEARGSGPLPRAGFPVNWGSMNRPYRCSSCFPGRVAEPGSTSTTRA